MIKVSGHRKEKTCRRHRVGMKNIIKTGDVVEMRNNEVGIVILEYNMIVHQYGWSDFKRYSDDLKYNTRNNHLDDFDIMKVYRPTKPHHCTFRHYEEGELIYECKKKICPTCGRELENE